MRSSRFSTQVPYCGRTGDGVPGCGCGAPRHCGRTGVGVPGWVRGAPRHCSGTGVGVPGCGCGAPRHCSRTGDGMPGCGCGEPRRGRRGRSGARVCSLRVRGCRVSAAAAGRVAAWPGSRGPAAACPAAAWTWPSLSSSPWPPRSRRNLKRARPSMHPKASLLSALGITRRPCGVPPLPPANPFTIELGIERSRLAGPGCPGRSQARGARAARRPGVPGPLAGPGCPGRSASLTWGGDPVRVHAE